MVCESIILLFTAKKLSDGNFIFARVQSPRDWKRTAGVLSIYRRNVNMDESSSDVWHNFNFGSYFLYKQKKHLIYQI